MDTWLDLDLDYFNGSGDPIEDFRAILEKTNPATRAVLVVEHHRVIAHLNAAISRKIIKIPFRWIHIDFHHDHYNYPQITATPKPMDCGNFGYYIKPKYIREFIWVCNESTESDCAMYGWDDKAVPYFCDNSIDYMVTTDLDDAQLEKQKIKFVTIVVSPDYMDGEILGMAETLVEMAREYYDLKTYVRPKQRVGIDLERPQNWQTVLLNKNLKEKIFASDNIFGAIR